MAYLKHQFKIKGKKYYRWVADPLEERATKNDCTEKKGILIHSKQDVCVHGYSVDFHSFGAFHAYPIRKGATKFFVPTYETKGLSYAAAQILIASNSSNNRIVIYKKRADGYEQRKVVRIDEFDVYQLRAWSTDFTGTYISSAEPITVFSGVDCGQVPTNVGWCDNMVAGIPPVDMLGKNFVCAPVDSSLLIQYVLQC